MSDVFDDGNHSRHNFSDANASETEDWISTDELDALTEEREVMGEEIEHQADRILRENLVPAIHSVAKMARSAQSERVRLDAGKYLIDRNLGKITDAKPKDNDPLFDLLESLIAEENEELEPVESDDTEPVGRQ